MKSSAALLQEVTPEFSRVVDLQPPVQPFIQQMQKPRYATPEEERIAIQQQQDCYFR